MSNSAINMHHASGIHFSSGVPFNFLSNFLHALPPFQILYNCFVIIPEIKKLWESDEPIYKKILKSILPLTALLSSLVPLIELCFNISFLTPYFFAASGTLFFAHSLYHLIVLSKAYYYNEQLPPDERVSKEELYKAAFNTLVCSVFCALFITMLAVPPLAPFITGVALAVGSIAVAIHLGLLIYKHRVKIAETLKTVGSSLLHGLQNMYSYIKEFSDPQSKNEIIEVLNINAENNEQLVNDSTSSVLDALENNPKTPIILNPDNNHTEKTQARSETIATGENSSNDSQTNEEKYQQLRQRKKTEENPIIDVLTAPLNLKFE